MVKYFACGEYGERFGRPHYHAIVFGVGDRRYFELCWDLGLVHVGSVSAKSIRYVADYMQKKEVGEAAKRLYGRKERPFQVCSQGLGRQYAFDNCGQLRRERKVTLDGAVLAIPRYYQKVLGFPKYWGAEGAEVRADEVVKRHCKALGITCDHVLSRDEKRRVYESMEMERRQMGKNLADLARVRGFKGVL